MKPSAIVVNTSRGGLVDTGALAEALAAGSLRGAGLDVLPEEPPDRDDPLLGLDNVIVTPHAAFLSEESVAELQRRAAGCVASVLRGELPPSVVNPEVLDGRPLRMQAPAEAARKVRARAADS
jgi:D-3-phosphoglycerate dehydrogenase